MIERPSFMHRDDGTIGTGFIVKSIDKRFICDYYKFGIFTLFYSEEKKDIDYYTLKELRKEIKIDTVKYETIKSFTKSKEYWEVHNELSLKKKIYLLEKREGKFNSGTGEFDYSYFILPLIYEGTRKNIVPTDLSINKE